MAANVVYVYDIKTDTFVEEDATVNAARRKSLPEKILQRKLSQPQERPRLFTQISTSKPAEFVQRIQNLIKKRSDQNLHNEVEMKTEAAK